MPQAVFLDLKNCGPNALPVAHFLILSKLQLK